MLRHLLHTKWCENIVKGYLLSCLEPSRQGPAAAPSSCGKHWEFWSKLLTFSQKTWNNAIKVQVNSVPLLDINCQILQLLQIILAEWLLKQSLCSFTQDV